MPPPRGYAPGAVSPPGAYPEYHPHLARTHEEGFPEPPVWPSPSGRLESLPPYGSPTITQSSYSDERTCECPLIAALNPIESISSHTAMPNDPSATSTSSPYPTRPDSATYTRQELPPTAYPQRHLQAAAVYGMCSAHLLPDLSPHLFRYSIRRVATSCPFQRSYYARPCGASTFTASTLTTTRILITCRVLLANTTPRHVVSIHSTSPISPPSSVPA